MNWGTRLANKVLRPLLIQPDSSQPVARPALLLGILLKKPFLSAAAKPEPH